MMHRIFNQRLQQQTGNLGLRNIGLGQIADFPLHFQPLAQTNLFYGQILMTQLQFILQGRHVARITHQNPEQVGQIFQSTFSTLRFGADQGQHGIDTVE